MGIHQCSILVPCPHFRPDQPCQFLNGQCWIQDNIVATGDVIKKIRNLQNTKESSQSINQCIKDSVSELKEIGSAIGFGNDVDLAAANDRLNTVIAKLESV